MSRPSVKNPISFQHSMRAKIYRTLESADASILNGEDIVSPHQGIRLAVKVERENRKRGNVLAGDSVLAIPALGGANLRIQHLGNVSRDRNKRGPAAKV